MLRRDCHVLVEPDDREGDEWARFDLLWQLLRQQPDVAIIAQEQW
jgi:hypothetical protein